MHRLHALAPIVVGTLLVAGCGGGGGGPGPIILTFGQSMVTATAFHNQGAAPYGSPVTVTLTVSLSSLPGGTTYVVVAMDQPVFLAQALSIRQNTDGSFSTDLTVDTLRPPGIEEGELAVWLCRDAGCNDPYPVTGNTVPYRITITPELAVTVLHNGERALTLAGAGHNCLADSKVRLLPGDTLEVDASTAITVDDHGAGFTVTPGTAPGNATWQAALEFSGVSSGCLSVNANDGSRQSIGVALELTQPVITGPAVPVALAGASGQGGPLPSQVVALGSENGRDAPYLTSVSYGCCQTGWLSVATDGTAPGDLTLQAATSNLQPGTYSATVWLNPRSGARSTSLEVRYTVTALTATPATLRFALDATSTSDQASLHVALGDAGAPLAWSATTDQPWVRVSAASGVSTDGATLVLDLPAVAALPAGQYAATATFTMEVGGGATALVQVPVALALAIPSVSGVMPHASVAGAGGDVTVWGSGFPPGFTGPVWIGGEQATSVTRTSDTSLRVSTPASLAAGAYPVRVNNALGLERSRASLQVIDTATRTATTIPAPGAKRAVVFDDVRRALYVANAGAGRLERYREEASWVKAADGTDELVLPDLKALALTPDGGSLLAVAGQAFRLVDTASFSLGPDQPTASAPSEARVDLAMTAAGQALFVGVYMANSTRAGILDLATGKDVDPQVFPYDLSGLAGSPDGSKVAIWERSLNDLGVWSGGPWPRYFGIRLLTTASFARWNGSRLMFAGAYQQLPIGGTTWAYGTRLFDEAFQPLPGSVAASYSGAAPAGAPLPTLTFQLSPSGRHRVFTWDGAAIKGYDLDGPLDALGLFPVLFEVPASPGADVSLTLSADERTAFLAGSDAVVVVPLPP